MGSTGKTALAYFAGGPLLGMQYQEGEAQAKAQKKALEEQRQQAREASDRAAAAQRRQQEAINRANQKKPDLAALLASEKEAALSGLGSTLLSGPGGVNPDKVLLGRKTLLGS